jgi:hypothetical protein
MAGGCLRGGRGAAGEDPKRAAPRRGRRPVRSRCCRPGTRALWRGRRRGSPAGPTAACAGRRRMPGGGRLPSGRAGRRGGIHGGACPERRLWRDLREKPSRRLHIENTVPPKPAKGAGIFRGRPGWLEALRDGPLRNASSLPESPSRPDAAPPGKIGPEYAIPSRRRARSRQAAPPMTVAPGGGPADARGAAPRGPYGPRGRRPRDHPARRPRPGGTARTAAGPWPPNCYPPVRRRRRRCS